MNIYYQNSSGKKIYFDREPYRMLSVSSLFDYEWEYETNGYNGNPVVKSTKSLSKKSVDIVIRGKTSRECMMYMTELVEAVDIDIVRASAGKFYVGNGYLRCYFVESKKNSKYCNTKKTAINFSILPQNGNWIYETTVLFRANGSADIYNSKRNLDYLFDYPFDYASGSTGKQLINDAFSDTDFEITIYGGCQNPEIYIAGHRYAVNCQLDTGEYLKINSITKKIYKVKINGETVNQYYLQDREYYIFKKIAAGKNSITWNGLFGFDITLLEKRSEPKWT